MAAFGEAALDKVTSHPMTAAFQKRRTQSTDVSTETALWQHREGMPSVSQGERPRSSWAHLVLGWILEVHLVTSNEDPSYTVLKVGRPCPRM